MLDQIENPDFVTSVEVSRQAAESQVGELHDVIEAGSGIGHGDEQDFHGQLPFARTRASVSSTWVKGSSRAGPTTVQQIFPLESKRDADISAPESENDLASSPFQSTRMAISFGTL